MPVRQSILINSLPRTDAILLCGVGGRGNGQLRKIVPPTADAESYALKLHSRSFTPHSVIRADGEPVSCFNALLGVAGRG